MPTALAQSGEKLDTLIVEPSTLEDRTSIQPDGPFAVLFFNEDALGTQIGVIYYGLMRSPKNGSWSLTDRFWQKEDWSMDVTTIAWGPNGKYLYVATSGTYGVGAVYELDLYSRIYRQIFPDIDDYEGWHPGYTSTQLIQIRRSTLTIFSWNTEDGYEKRKKVEIPLTDEHRNGDTRTFNWFMENRSQVLKTIKDAHQTAAKILDGIHNVWIHRDGAVAAEMSDFIVASILYRPSDFLKTFSTSPKDFGDLVESIPNFALTNFKDDNIEPLKERKKQITNTLANFLKSGADNKLIDMASVLLRSFEKQEPRIID